MASQIPQKQKNSRAPASKHIQIPGNAFTAAEAVCMCSSGDVLGADSIAGNWAAPSEERLVSLMEVGVLMLLSRLTGLCSMMVSSSSAASFCTGSVFLQPLARGEGCNGWYVENCRYKQSCKFVATCNGRGGHTPTLKHHAQPVP